MNIPQIPFATKWPFRTLASIILLHALSPSAGAQSPDSFNPDASGSYDMPVRSLAVQADGKILMSGAFTTVGAVRRNRIARLNADGTLDISFNPNANGNVFSLAVQADGKILMSGFFTSVGGVTRNRIARLNADGTLDSTFNPNANDSVYSLAVQADGKILMSGVFTTVGAVTRNRIARLNADGTLDSTFNPNANTYVYGLAVQTDGKILMSGAFTTVGGVTRNRIARVNADGTLDTSFNPNADADVYSLAVQADGKILMGGIFTTVSGAARNYIARLNTNGTADSSFNPNTDGYPESFALQADGKIIIGGGISDIGGVIRNSIARLNANGSLDSSFNPNANSEVSSLAIQSDGKILMGGLFTTVGGVTRNYIARLSNNIASTQVLSVTGTGQIDWVRGGSAHEVEQVAFETWNGSAWVSQGAATRVAGGWRKTGLSLPTSTWVRARGRTSGGYGNCSSGIIEQVATYGSGTFPDIAVQDAGGATLDSGNVVIDFGNQDWPMTSTPRTFTVTNVGTAALTGLAMSIGGYDPTEFVMGTLGSSSLAPGASTTFTVSFAPNGGGNRSAIISITSNDFDETPFSMTLKGFGILQDASFNPNATGYPLSFAGLAMQADGKALIEGNFSAVGGVARYGIARLNADGTADPFFNPNNGFSSNASFSCLAVQADGKILMGGTFTTVGWVTRNCIARLNTDGTLDSTFNPNPNHSVHSLAVQADGKILMAGDFTTVGGVARSRIARLNPDGTLDSTFNPNASYPVYSLAVQADGKILMAGFFTAVGGVTRNYIARLNADGTLDNSFNPNANYTVFTLALQADGKILIGGGALPPSAGWPAEASPASMPMAHWTFPSIQIPTPPIIHMFLVTPPASHCRRTARSS
jgi:uncharacterized delta-60 repeat protein